MGASVAKAEVSAIEAKENQGEQKDHEDRYAEQYEDEEKVRLLWGYLLDFHSM
jgi:hypothetical protein